MIAAILAPVAALAGRIGPALSRLEARHWVALVGSAALHLGVLLGLSQAPPQPLPPPMTFEVKLEPPPAATQPKLRQAKAKPKASKAKKIAAKKKPNKPRVREPHTLQAEWKSESKPARDAPTVNLPDAHAIGVRLATPNAAETVSKAANRTASPSQAVVAGSALSEPGGAGAGTASAAAAGGDPGLTLAAAQGQGKALKVSSGSGAQGSDALAGSAAASGNLAVASLSASAAAGSSLNRAASGGGHSVQASDFSSRSAGALDGGEPSGVRLTMAGVLSSLPALPAGSGSLAGGQFSGASGSSAATAGQGSQANLATAASSGQPAVVTAAGPTRAGSGSETSSSEQGAAASGGSSTANLASASAAPVMQNSKPGSSVGAASDGGNPARGGMAGATTAPRASKTALALSGGGDAVGQAPTPRRNNPGLGDASGKPAATATGKVAGNGKLAVATVGANPLAGKYSEAATGQSGNTGSVPGSSGAAASGDQAHGGKGQNLAGKPAGEQAGQSPSGGKSGMAGMDPDSSGAVPRGLGATGDSGGTGRFAATQGMGAGLPGHVTAAAGLVSGPNASAALSPGEPGSAPRLAVAMQVVPAILEMRSAGARSSFRTNAGEGGSGTSERSAATTLTQVGGGEGTSLPGRGAGAPALSTGSRQASIASGGGDPASGGKLQGVKVAAVQQMRADSQVQPLDVLAPSTYCPLPGHVQPDNRPRETAQDITEKPAYASENPSFAFPLRAWAYGHQGRVTVRVQVMADGTPGQMWIKQSSGSGILDVDVREQLAKYRFKPARKNGQPVTAWIDVPVDYRLNAEK